MSFVYVGIKSTVFCHYITVIFKEGADLEFIASCLYNQVEYILKRYLKQFFSVGV